MQLVLKVCRTGRVLLVSLCFQEPAFHGAAWIFVHQTAAPEFSEFLGECPEEGAMSATGRKLGKSCVMTDYMHLHGGLCHSRLRRFATGVESALQATSQFQDQTNARAVDIQRLRHLHLIFQPLEYVPSGPVFKKHIAQVYMED